MEIMDERVVDPHPGARARDVEVRRQRALIAAAVTRARMPGGPAQGVLVLKQGESVVSAAPDAGVPAGVIQFKVESTT